LKEEFYDEKGRLVRTMFFKDIKRLDGRLIPTRWLLTPQLKTDQRTEFEVLEIDFDVAIPDRTFTRQYLERSR
ncbi:MAG: outer membrane lipoprotein-sorting protein, partial [Candidatus Glassbacteria bacterium]